jgi:hypothetical protein
MGNVRDIENTLKESQVVDPVVITADANGASVDMFGYDSVAFYALLGESGDTLSGSVYVELEVEESTDDSTFTDVADADITNSVTGTNTGTFGKIDAAAEDDAVFMTQYRGTSRYVRPVINLTGTHTNGIPIGILAIRSQFNNPPVS